MFWRKIAIVAAMIGGTALVVWARYRDFIGGIKKKKERKIHVPPL